VNVGFVTIRIDDDLIIGAARTTNLGEIVGCCRRGRKKSC